MELTIWERLGRPSRSQFYGYGFVNDVIRQAVKGSDDVMAVTKIGADPEPGGRCRCARLNGRSASGRAGRGRPPDVR